MKKPVKKTLIESKPSISPTRTIQLIRDILLEANRPLQSYDLHLKVKKLGLEIKLERLRYYIHYHCDRGRLYKHKVSGCPIYYAIPEWLDESGNLNKPIPELL